MVDIEISQLLSDAAELANNPSPELKELIRQSESADRCCRNEYLDSRTCRVAIGYAMLAMIRDEVLMLAYEFAIAKVWPEIETE